MHAPGNPLLRIPKEARLFASILLLGMLPDVVLGQPAGLTGPDSHANVQLKDGADVLPPGGATATKKLVVDTGARGTTLSRADAKQLGLLKADDTDNGFAAGDVKIGTAVVGAPEPTAHFSKLLSIMAKGKKADGTTDNDAAFKDAPNKRVVYPKKNEPDLESLLGTNFVSNLGTTRLTINPDGAASFFDAPPPVVPVRAIRLVEEILTPELVGAGLDPRRIVEGITLNDTVAADFFLVTGSPFTIISESLQLSLGLSAIGDFDLFNDAPDIFDRLMIDGFFGATDPGLFDIVSIDSFAVPTEGGIDLIFEDVPVLVNPFEINQNIYGTNILFRDGLPTVVDYINNQVHVGVSEVPEPSILLIFSIGLLGMTIFGWRAKAKQLDLSGAPQPRACRAILPRWCLYGLARVAEPQPARAKRRREASPARLDGPR